jgi:hypothetical protein
MNRLLYGDPNPAEIECREIMVECSECKGVGGFYLDLELNECVSRDEYLENKGKREYELIPCEICEGKGYQIEYEEINPRFLVRYGA